jgi:hypothetical protein
MAVVTGNSSDLAPLLAALDLSSSHCTRITLDFPAQEICTMTVERILTTDEIEALSDWFVTEGISPIQTGITTYSLERREQADGEDC